jgi:hypothetical protein
VKSEFKKHILKTIELADWRTPNIKQRYNSLFGKIQKSLFVIMISCRLKFSSCVVVQNGFPYTLLLNTLTNGKHLVIFYIHHKPSVEQIQNKLYIKHSKKTIILDNILDFLVWENPAKLKSISQLHHLQLIIEQT